MKLSEEIKSTSAFFFIWSESSCATSALRRVQEITAYSARTYAEYATIFFDQLTYDHTGFRNFGALINAPVNSYPSLPKAPQVYSLSQIFTLLSRRKVTAEIWYAELDLLALAYNIAQEARGDNRRAIRS